MVIPHCLECKQGPTCVCPEKHGVSKIPRPVRSRSLSLNKKPCVKCQPCPRSRSLNSQEGQTRVNSQEGQSRECRPATEKLRSRLPIKIQEPKTPKQTSGSRSEKKNSRSVSPESFGKNGKTGKPNKCTNNCKTCMCHYCLKEKKRKQEERDKKNRILESERWNINLIRGRWEDQCFVRTPEVMSRSHPATCQCTKCFVDAKKPPVEIGAYDCNCCTCENKETDMEKCDCCTCTGKKQMEKIIDKRKKQENKKSMENCICCVCGEKETFYDARDNLDDLKVRSSQFIF